MNYKFEVNEQEANLILQALAELPAKVSMNLIGKLQMQAQQQQPKEEKKADIKQVK